MPEECLQKHISAYPPISALPGADALYIEWLGSGIYYLRPDNVWAHRNSDAGCWKTAIGISSDLEITKAVGAIPMVNAEINISILLSRLGLPRLSYYHDIRLEQCEALALEAERWRIPYVWAEYLERGYLFQKRRYFIFQWRFGS